MNDGQKIGRITKGFGGFYFVEAAGTVYTCRIRGRLKRENSGVLVGDYVEFLPLSPTEGVIENILPRQNQLIRPKVANIDQAIIVLAAASPSPDWLLLDRLLVFCHHAGILSRICVNKSDLAEPALRQEVEMYHKAGFDVLLASAKQGYGKEILTAWLAEKVSILAGPSGVGKSSLLNLIEPGFALSTGGISEKLGRGRHTTRTVEIFPLQCGGWVADTPGFSLLDLPKDLQPADLSQAYPEMARQELCRFDGCLHQQEPGCAIKMAVNAGQIAEQRYQRYLTLLEELQNREELYQHD